MTKSELISALVRKKTQLSAKDIELVVHTLLECMSATLANGERIEIRGFGSFTLHYRPPRFGRNPKSGNPISVPARYAPHFKPAKELRERVTQSLTARP